VALIALASTPVVARSRLFCRYTGIEISDCRQQPIQGRSEIQVEGCCDRRTTQPPVVILIGHYQESFAPVQIALPVALSFAAPARPPPIRVLETAPAVFLITRALLI